VIHHKMIISKIETLLDSSTVWVILFLFGIWVLGIAIISVVLLAAFYIVSFFVFIFNKFFNKKGEYIG